MSVNDKMTAIADNIRSKTGGTETLSLDGMANGIDDVFYAGKKAHNDELWNNSGTRTDYQFMGTFWTQKNFKPNKDLVVSTCSFYRHNWQGKAYDLAEHLESFGVKIIPQTTANIQLFYYGWFTRIPELDFSSCSGSFDRTFYGISPLVTIDKLILPPEGSITNFNQTFYSCTKLTNIIIEGVIDQTISFSNSPLSINSMKSIISCLKDFTGTTSEHTYTVTFKTSAFEVLEAEGTTAVYNGTPCTWAELIDNKKWNLVKA